MVFINQDIVRIYTNPQDECNCYVSQIYANKNKDKYGFGDLLFECFL